MAPPRKRKPPAPGRELKVRLPMDVADLVEARAKAEGRSQNRVVINLLAQTPSLEQCRSLGELVQRMDEVLARYGSRIVMHDLTEQLGAAADGVLAAEGSGALQAALDRLRVVRTAMVKTQHMLETSERKK
jgi:hypothetical protein